MPVSKQRYTSTAISLHWLLALLIAGGFGLGMFMSDLPVSPAKLQYYAWHKWIGVTVFGLAVMRAGWRLTHPAPALPAGMPNWQHKAAAVSHGLLYLLIFTIPLSGWLYSSAAGFQTVYLTLIPIPDLVSKDKVLAALLKQVHEVLTTVLMWVVIVHVAAALKHHFVDRNGLLHRMWFGR